MVLVLVVVVVWPEGAVELVLVVVLVVLFGAAEATIGLASRVSAPIAANRFFAFIILLQVYAIKIGRRQRR